MGSPGTVAGKLSKGLGAKELQITGHGQEAAQLEEKSTRRVLVPTLSKLKSPKAEEEEEDSSEDDSEDLEVFISPKLKKAKQQQSSIDPRVTVTKRRKLKLPVGRPKASKGPSGAKVEKPELDSPKLKKSCQAWNQGKTKTEIPQTGCSCT